MHKEGRATPFGNPRAFKLEFPPTDDPSVREKREQMCNSCPCQAGYHQVGIDNTVCTRIYGYRENESNAIFEFPENQSPHEHKIVIERYMQCNIPEEDLPYSE